MFNVLVRFSALGTNSRLKYDCAFCQYKCMYEAVILEASLYMMLVAVYCMQQLMRLNGASFFLVVRPAWPFLCHNVFEGLNVGNCHIFSSCVVCTCRNARISCTTGKPEYSFDGEGDPVTDNPLVYVRSFNV